MKSGIGDVRRAIALGDASTGLQICGLLLLSIPGALRARETHGLYGFALFAAAQFLLGGVILWLAALQIEFWATRTCL
jgi:hypothetical protein